MSQKRKRGATKDVKGEFELNNEDLKKIFKEILISFEEAGNKLSKSNKENLCSSFSSVVESISVTSEKRMKVGARNEGREGELSVQLKKVGERVEKQRKEVLQFVEDSVRKQMLSLDFKLTQEVENEIPNKVKSSQLPSTEKKLEKIFTQMRTLSEKLPQTKQKFQTLSTTIQKYVNAPPSNTEKVLKEIAKDK